MNLIMSHQTSGHVLLPAGTYYIGDPCYVFPNHDKWMEVLEANDYFNHPSAILVDANTGYAIWGASTKYGDGRYSSNVGFDFPVDSGTLGAVDVRFISADDMAMALSDRCGIVRTFTENVKCFIDDNHTFYIDTIRIDTMNLSDPGYFDDCDDD